ncbi:MAG: Anthranilate phosphoribosyltransferase [Oscillospiraceae bacterium]|nr:Anthranilate phosphoribosyltransferase [Oscillospiraceae bacterium]
MILLIDNYDSFTYNLYQAIGQLYEDIKVVRNDEITIEEIEKLSPEALVISPGPGFPDSAGISIDAIKHFSGKFPILGVCLGHQAIAEAFGGKIVHADAPLHGKKSEITLDTSCPLFSGLPEKITVGRYHSLVAEKRSLPESLSVVAEDDKGNIMAIRHKSDPTYGVQFHPESILTPVGNNMVSNFLSIIAGLKITLPTAPSIPPEKRNALKKYIFKVIEGEHLTEEEAFAAMDCIMSDGATNSQIGSFLTALRMKGETIDEITGFARVMRQKSQEVPFSRSSVDIVGTGGDLANTFNISTTSAFVIAGAGLEVAKHGNRSVSSKSGAADVLEALGVNISLSPVQAAECIKACGLTFLFAPCFHGSMKYAVVPRREIGVRSVFNILGPLANPALADYILLGVYDEELMETMAKVLIRLGIKGAMIVHGSDGLDEITISDTTKVCEIKDKKLIKYEIDPRELGIEIVEKSEVVGGTAEENALITLNILKGEKGPKRDIVLLNAGSAIYTAGKADTLQQGIEMARESIDSGAALEKLNRLKDFTNQL